MTPNGLAPGTSKGAQPLGLRRRSETELTHRLKWAAWQWLYVVAGCRAIGFEVRLEGPSGRVADVVGLGPGNCVYLVEVKSSRADALRDNHTQRDRRRLMERGQALEEAIELTGRILEAAANLARADGIDNPAGSPAYRQAEADHARITGRLKANRRRLETFSTKFHDPAYLRTADYHYIMAPHGLVRPSELPPYWGLLDETPALVVEAPQKQVRRVTAHVLRNIAKANTRDIMTACGIEVPEGLPEKTEHDD